MIILLIIAAAFGLYDVRGLRSIQPSITPPGTENAPAPTGSRYSATGSNDTIAEHGHRGIASSQAVPRCFGEARIGYRIHETIRPTTRWLTVEAAHTIRAVRKTGEHHETFTKATLVAAGALALAATGASAAVVCNDEGDCWHVKGEAKYKPSSRFTYTLIIGSSLTRITGGANTKAMAMAQRRSDRHRLTSSEAALQGAAISSSDGSSEPSRLGTTPVIA